MYQRFNDTEASPSWCSNALANEKSLLELETKRVFHGRTESLEGKVRETCLFFFFLIEPLTHQPTCLIKHCAGVSHLHRCQSLPWSSGMVSFG